MLVRVVALRIIERRRGVVADRHHKAQDGRKHEDTPIVLAARAAGMDPRTFQRYRYLLDGDAATEIEGACEAGEIGAFQVLVGPRGSLPMCWRT